MFMQTLDFQPAWDKTISHQDRQIIIDKFKQTKQQKDIGIAITFLWEARNYKDDLLITTLIHNCDDESIELTDTTIAYQKDLDTIATSIVTINEVIAPKTTMPWTFIFSKKNMTDGTPELVINHS